MHMQGLNTDAALQQLQLEERQKGRATVEVSGDHLARLVGSPPRLLGLRAL